MIKTIFKEGAIVLLLCVAILGILSVLFYDYNPIGKVIPNAQPYTVPENIKNELEEKVEAEEIQTQNKVYTVEGVDLKVYKKSNTYNPSKEHPFLTTSADAGATNSGTTNNNSNVNTNNNTNNTGNNSSGTGNGQTSNNQTSNNGSTGLK